MAAYPEIVNRPSAAASLTLSSKTALAAVRRGWHGLAQVLAGPEPAPAFPWPPERARRAAYSALAFATLALCLINESNVHGLGGTPPTQQLPASLGLRVLAVAVVAPL